MDLQHVFTNTVSQFLIISTLFPHSVYIIPGCVYVIPAKAGIHTKQTRFPIRSGMTWKSETGMILENKKRSNYITNKKYILKLF